MGGRGRGRGRGGAAMSLNMELLGISRADDIPGHLKPPPLYPPLGILLSTYYFFICNSSYFKPENRPIPLNDDIEDKYLMTVYKELNIRMKSSPFHLVTTNVVKKGIECFYDR